MNSLIQYYIFFKVFFYSVLATILFCLFFSVFISFRFIESMLRLSLNLLYKPDSESKKQIENSIFHLNQLNKRNIIFQATHSFYLNHYLKSFICLFFLLIRKFTISLKVTVIPIKHINQISL